MTQPLNISGRCAANDEQLFANIDSALERGLPELTVQEDPHAGRVAIVGSGPSVAGQIATIHQMKAEGVPILAVRDAHDWLIHNGVIPDYALSVDPLEKAAECFRNPHPEVHYLIASQSHPKMLDYLKGYKVTLWHPYFQKGQKYPKHLIPGGETSGLRAIAVLYVMGWRDFHLFGFDSCLEGNTLRINGDGLKHGDKAIPVQIEPEGEVFYCNLAMAQQAQSFQDQNKMFPDATFEGYGRGLIQAIIAKRQKNLEELAETEPLPENHRVSFIHAGGPPMASYRYRAAIPAEGLGASIGDLGASTLVFAKPRAEELFDMGRAKARGQWIVVDFCDSHFEWMHYQEALRLADVVTCPTETMRDIIAGYGREAIVIDDPYEFESRMPHSVGNRLLWFGHHVNRESLHRVLPDIEGYPIHVVSNFPGAIPWSHETMLAEFAYADIVILPATEKYKSCNRAVESIRRGCFVVAEPHPSLEGFPGIWIGNIKEGVEWASTHLREANQLTSLAQKYVMERFTPRICASAWRQAIQRPTTSAEETKNGTDGSALISQMAQT
jgi:hypothetical protein